MWEEHDVGKAAHLMTPSKEGKKIKENGREQEGTKRKGEKKM